MPCHGFGKAVQVCERVRRGLRCIGIGAYSSRISALDFCDRFASTNTGAR